MLTETDMLKKTPFYDLHIALGGKIVDFNGWQMPVYYSSIISEHQWTRSSCTFFDVSHLGNFRLKGPGAFAFLQQRLTNDLTRLKNGKILYNLICDEKGYVIDDILVYQVAPEDFYLVVNAGNIENDREAFRRYLPDTVQLDDESSQTAGIAVQGPAAQGILEKLFGLELSALPYYYFRRETWQGHELWVSRSGYTGEDGFEIFCGIPCGMMVWEKLQGEGKSLGALPAGLGARNTLRLEAGNPLYGHEMSLETTPLEAGLDFAVSMDKGGFVGRDMLLYQKSQGLRRRLVGFKVLDKAIARDGYPIVSKGRSVGKVTSGSYAPTLGFNIGMGFVTPGLTEPGTPLEIEIHGRLAKAEVVKRPFVAQKHKKIVVSGK